MTEVRIEIIAGAGGRESHAWAEMLLHMYERWAARQSYSVTAKEAKLQHAVIEMSGTGAERLYAEHGIHRLVRISPSDPQNRRHISFVAVCVTPIVEGHIIAPPPSWHDRSSGHQIRSYVLDPYKMAKDLRTGITREDVEAVLDGDIDDFLDGAAAAGIPWDFDPEGPASCAAVAD